MKRLDIDIALTLGDFGLQISQSIELEGVTAIFGPSGSGKTTLLRVIAGLETRARGTVSFDGSVWQSPTGLLPPHVRSIGYVFQDGRLFEHMSVADNVRFAERFRKATRDGIGSAAAISALGLEPLLDRKPATLSGGERQRVGIARALVGGPQLLLMDEPVSSLDSARRRSIVDIIAGLPGRFGVPVIHVTHDRAELMRLADHMLFLERGQIVAAGDVSTVMHRAEFSGDTAVRDPGSILAARVTGHAGRLTTLSLGGQMLRVPRLDSEAGKALRVRIAARDVVIATEQPRGLSIRNVLQGRIESVMPHADALCDVDLLIDGQRLTARLTADAVEELELVAGRDVFALVKSVAVDDSLSG